MRWLPCQFVAVKQRNVLVKQYHSTFDVLCTFYCLCRKIFSFNLLHSAIFKPYIKNYFSSITPQNGLCKGPALTGSINFKTFTSFDSCYAAGIKFYCQKPRQDDDLVLTSVWPWPMFDVFSGSGVCSAVLVGVSASGWRQVDSIQGQIQQWRKLQFYLSICRQSDDWSWDRQVHL